MWTVETGMVQLKGRDYSLDSWVGFSFFMAVWNFLLAANSKQLLQAIQCPL